MAAQASPSVLVASDDPLLLDELIRHLEELPLWRLVGSASSVDQISDVAARTHPEAIVLSDALAYEAQRAGVGLGAARLIVIGRKEHAQVLRAAMKLGAAGFVLWPSEKKELKGLVEQAASSFTVERGSGSLDVIYSPKGGSGSSVLSAHLAAEIAACGKSVMLADLDLDHGDIAAVVSSDEDLNKPEKAIADLLRVVDELTPQVMNSIATSHPLGFKVLTSPSSLGEGALAKPSDLVRIAEVARETADHVVIDLPSGYSELVLSLAEASDRFRLVVVPTVLSLRRTRDTMKLVRSAGIDASKASVIFNQAGGEPISAQDVEGIVGAPVCAEVAANIDILRSSDKGEISEVARRSLRSLAHQIANVEMPASRSAFRRRDR